MGEIQQDEGEMQEYKLALEEGTYAQETLASPNINGEMYNVHSVD